jgi:hemerythrin-like domain-containing protein
MELPMTGWGRKGAVSIILREHQQLTTAIGGMLQFVRLRENGSTAPGLAVLRSILYYIREYPERVHHPKEERYLFTRIRARTSQIDEVLNDLDRQHAEGEDKVRDLEDALTRYELTGISALPALSSGVEQYVMFYANHRRIEEEVVLPVALRTLTAEDWEEVDAAFGANRDPFEGVELEDDLDKLYRMIANIIPEVRT